MTTPNTLPSIDVLHGDCLDVMKSLPSASFDLVYLDPPFLTGQVQRTSEHSFDDRWDDMSAYLEFMDQRIREIHRLLTPSGSILLHCDWRTCHRLRVILDDVFGAEHIVNHLIWKYGLGGSSPKGFARKHDDILFYARGSRWWFDPPMVPATSNRMAGKMKKATDVIEIASINNMAKERVGWPTQKPIELLKLLVGACCPPGGKVLDPFCGSGTTLMAAHALGRNSVGIDRDTEAIRLTRERAEILSGS